MSEQWIKEYFNKEITDWVIDFNYCLMIIQEKLRGVRLEK